MSGWHRKNKNTDAERARRARYSSPEHQAARRAFTLLVERGQASCWRCGRTLYPKAWHVGHNDAGTQIMGPECIPCNRGHSTRKGALVANAKRKTQRTCRRETQARL